MKRSMKYLHILILVFCGLLLPFSSAKVHAIPFTLDIIASADGDIHLLGVVNPTFTVNDHNASVQMSMSGGGSIKRGYFEFGLSSIPDDITITSASLLLMTSGLISNTYPTADLYFYGYAGDGQITLDDWNAEATLMGSANYPVGTVANGGTPVHTVLSNTMTNLDPLLAVLSGANEFFGIQVRVPSFITLNVHSIESTYSAAVFPTLRINYEATSGPSPVPEPGAITLLGLALAGLGLYGYRRKSNFQP